MTGTSDGNGAKEGDSSEAEKNAKTQRTDKRTGGKSNGKTDQSGSS